MPFLETRTLWSCGAIVMVVAACGGRVAGDHAAPEHAPAEVSDAAAPPQGPKAMEIAMYAGTACAVIDDGTVKCWATGDGPTFWHLTSTATTLPGFANVVHFAIGEGFGCALLANGAVECMGVNDGGQVGDGTTEDRTTPVPVAGLTDAIDVELNGECASFALHANGTVAFWGGVDNTGFGCALDSVVPKPYEAPADVVDIASPARAYVLGDGTVFLPAGDRHLTFGGKKAKRYAAPYVLLTDGTIFVDSSGMEPASVPADVARVTDLSTNDDAACAVTDGHVRCWPVSRPDILAPGVPSAETEVPGLTEVAEVESASSSDPAFCARRVDGSVWCWRLSETPTPTSDTLTSTPPVRVM